MKIDARTKIAGIIGDPVAHSRSPAMHNAGFAALGLNYRYLAFRVDTSDLAAAVKAIRALGLVGINVTVPHKERILPLLDSLSPRATQVGAVNTVVNRRDHLYGDNTDVVGFLRSLRAARVRLRGRRAVVIGAGGAARGVLVGLAGSGVDAICIANRTLSRARRLAHQFATADLTVDPIPLAGLQEPRYLADAAIVVNTTALGWQRAAFPGLAYHATPISCLFYDLAYGRSTDFLRRARRARRRAMDGTEMLLYQGAYAFTLWTRRRAPLRVMRAALQ